jgi:hypothetical protein
MWGGGVVWAHCGRGTLCSTNSFSSSMGWSQTTKNLRTPCRLPQVKKLGMNHFFYNSSCHPFLFHLFIPYLPLQPFISLSLLSLSFISTLIIPPPSFLSPFYLKAQYQPHCALYCITSLFTRTSSSLVTAHKRSWRTYLHRLLQSEVLLRFWVVIFLCCSAYCFLCCSMYCLFFCRSVYCLYVNVYCTNATGCQPNCS